MGMFDYVMVLASVIIGLGVTHLLTGVAGIIQHPQRAKIYWVHLLWVAATFLRAIFWWWFEFGFSGATLDLRALFLRPRLCAADLSVVRLAVPAGTSPATMDTRIISTRAAAGSSGSVSPQTWPTSSTLWPRASRHFLASARSTLAGRR